MTSTVTPVLEQVSDLLAGVCPSAEGGALDAVSPADLVGLLLAVGRAQRLVDAVVTSVAGEVLVRDRRLSAERVSSAAGCRDATELLRRTLRVDAGTARRYVTAADGMHQDLSLSTGEHLPARFEALGQVLRDGDLSVTGFLAATGPLARASSRISAADLARADAVLADAARGVDLPDDAGRPGPAPTTDELAALANYIVLKLDPDGQEPEDDRANRKRGLTLGRLRNGTVPVRGDLLPDVAGQLQRLLDALLNPKADRTSDNADGTAGGASDAAAGGSGETTSGVRFTDTDTDTDTDDADVDVDADTAADADAAAAGPGGLPEPVDPRSPAQKRHDAFASILTTAAGIGGFPTLGGAAPTLVVSMTAEDYANEAGRATIEGTGWDVPFGVARQVACAGGIQRVLFDEHEQIVSIGTTARIFNALQRRAITLRDRECVIPGCHIPATWCEIHHVTEYAQGGPTHTSNGVALCWHHHRTLDTSGWEIRMRQGTPEIRGPSWWDPHRGWHRPRIRAGTRRTLADALSPPRG